MENITKFSYKWYIFVEQQQKIIKDTKTNKQSFHLDTCIEIFCLIFYRSRVDEYGVYMKNIFKFEVNKNKKGA